MVVPSRSFRLKTAADLQLWLEREISPRLSKSTEMIAHGGTALSLLGLKESSKDVDFAFRGEGDFNRMLVALERLKYTKTAELRPNQKEIMVRLENAEQQVDVVDLRFPTWNNWRLTRRVMAQARRIPYGPLRLVLPERDVIFLFKSYPLRDVDLQDLEGVIDRSTPNQTNVVGLFNEQDRLNREELLREAIEYEPLINVLNLRTRFAGSLSLLSPAHKKRVSRLAEFSKEKFHELELEIPLGTLVRHLRDPNTVVDWHATSGGRTDDLRKRLSLPTK